MGFLRVCVCVCGGSAGFTWVNSRNELDVNENSFQSWHTLPAWLMIPWKRFGFLNVAVSQQPAENETLIKCETLCVVFDELLPPWWPSERWRERQIQSLLQRSMHVLIKYGPLKNEGLATQLHCALWGLSVLCTIVPAHAHTGPFAIPACFGDKPWYPSITRQCLIKW